MAIDVIGMAETKALIRATVVMVRDPLLSINLDVWQALYQASAHACSEIGLKWFLFALHDLGTALGFVSVLDFFGDFVSSNTGETGKPELKPFLTILGTRMRAHATRAYGVLVLETRAYSPTLSSP